MLGAKLDVSKTVELVVDDRHEAVEGVGPACGQLVQELGDVLSFEAHCAWAIKVRRAERGGKQTPAP